MAFSDGLGLSVYGSVEAGSMIRATAPLIPVMYFDTTVDCMLKGLGEQVHSMHINIIDSASSLILVLLLVPFLGIGGYIISVYFCECLNCALSLHRLRKITGAGAGVVRCTLTSVVCITVSVVVVKTFHGLSVSAGITVCAVIYLALSVIFGRVPDLREKRKRKFKNNVEIGA